MLLIIILLLLPLVPVAVQALPLTFAGYAGSPSHFGSSYIRSGTATSGRAHSPSSPFPSISMRAEFEKRFMGLSKENSRSEEMLARTEG